MLDKIKTALSGNIRLIMYIVLAVIVSAGLYFYHDWQESRYQKAVTMSQEQFQQVAEIEKRLNVSETNAKALQEAYEREKNKPVTTFYVQAPTLDTAAKSVEQRINNNDKTLPAAALEKTDRTAVVINSDQQKVDVVKINLSKDHKVKAGATYIDSSAYWNLGYQQKRLEAIVHMQGKDIKGATGMYTVVEW